MMDPANTEEAKRIRNERETKHNKQTSFPTPDLYSSNDNNNDEENTIETENENRQKTIDTIHNESVGIDGYNNVQKKGTKRRGSQEIENDPRNNEEAIVKRESRQNKHHRKESSAAIPNQFFKENYDPEKEVKIQEQKTGIEAEQKRKQRAEKNHSAQQSQDIGDHHRRKSSFVYRELFGNDGNDDENMDPKSREKARKEERRKSRQLLFKHVGDKGHLSDEDAQIQSNEKSQRYDFNNVRKKAKGKENNRDKQKKFYCSGGNSK